MISNTDAYRESLNCVKSIINIIANSCETFHLDLSKDALVGVKFDEKIKDVTKKSNLKLISSSQKMKKPNNSDKKFSQLNQNISLENIKNVKLFMFERLPWWNKYLALDKENRVSVIFRVNLYDLWTLVDFLFKLNYFNSKILSVCKSIPSNKNILEAIQCFSGYFFINSWNYSPQIKVFHDLVRFISIEANDFPTKKEYKKMFDSSYSSAQFLVKYSKNKVEKNTGLEKASNCLEIENHDSDIISSFQKIQPIELKLIDSQMDVDIEKDKNQVHRTSPTPLDEFGNFKVPITCNQFINFVTAQETPPNDNDEIGFDLTQCGTKVFNKSSQVTKAIKSDDLERYKQILAQKSTELSKPILLDLTNKIVTNKSLDLDKKFIEFIPIADTSMQIKQRTTNKNQTNSQLNSNENKSQSQPFDLECKKAQKRRSFMKIGLNKQQKLKGSLHAGFLQTHINKD